MLECVECGTRAEGAAEGWSAVRIDDPDSPGDSEIVVYCAACLAREFGGVLAWIGLALVT